MSQRIAVLVSGGGTTLESLAATIRRGALDARIACVVASRDSCGAMGRAREAGVEPVVIPRRAFPSTAEFSREVFAAVEGSGATLACLGGFLSLLEIPGSWRARVLNMHPSLLPAFGGKGLYGERVHRAVLASGARWSGCTVHYVDEVYDHGPIVLQRTVPVLEDDTTASLARRVFEEECRLYPEAIRLHSEGRLRVEGGRVRILAPEEVRRPTLRTGRLVLRPFLPGDASEVRRLAGERSVADTTLRIPHPYPEGEAQRWIGTHEEAFRRGMGCDLAITLDGTGELVGAVGLALDRENAAGELGYWVAPAHWGRGYATEAARALVAHGLEQLGLERVQACAFARNPASGRVLRKLGMRLEGVSRAAVRKWGRREDVERYALLRGELAPRRGGP